MTGESVWTCPEELRCEEKDAVEGGEDANVLHEPIADMNAIIPVNDLTDCDVAPSSLLKVIQPVGNSTLLHFVCANRIRDPILQWTTEVKNSIIRYFNRLTQPLGFDVSVN